MRFRFPRMGLRMVLRMVLGTAVALGTVLALTGTAGCGSKDEPTSVPSSAPSHSVPPGLDTTPPEKPTAAPTKQSAAEFGEYFAHLVQYSIRIRNVRPVMGEALDQARCNTCRQVSEFIQGLKKDQVWEIGPDLEPGTFRTRPREDGFRVSGGFRYPASRSVKIDGTRDSDDAAGDYKFAADLVWDADGSHWRVLDYTFTDKSAE